MGVAGVIVSGVLGSGHAARAADLGNVSLQVPGVAGADVKLGGSSGSSVAVFSTELTPLSRFDDPSGCKLLPPAAHVLVNLTPAPVRVYADPVCLGPSLTVQPGFGSHVTPGAGSFSATAAAPVRRVKRRRGT